MAKSKLVIPEDAVVVDSTPARAVGNTAPVLTKEASAVTLGKLEIIHEGLKTVQSISRLLATNKEWNARLEIEARQLEKARIEAKSERGKLANEREHLEQMAQRTAPLIDMAHYLVRQIREADLPAVEKSQHIEQLIKLGQTLASFGK